MGVYPEAPVVAVGACVFKDGRVLLVRRANPPAQGLWAIPGGRVELGETLAEAARREIREETGVRIAPGEAVYTFDVIERDAQGRIRFHYVIVDLLAQYLGGRPRPGSDAAEVRWVSPAELSRMDVNPKTLWLLRHRLDFGR
jgi:ADP-ribose pyrophosphatase